MRVDNRQIPKASFDHGGGLCLSSPRLTTVTGCRSVTAISRTLGEARTSGPSTESDAKRQEKKKWGDYITLLSRLDRKNLRRRIRQGLDRASRCNDVRLMSKSGPSVRNSARRPLDSAHAT